ncbi:hypothetical protein B0A58_15065 [Flavobacterium branchiophilum NBRC 15030 = ATCC 35035]|nr:hypothetical protein B0A58_15065 [Flavobacterium branchiophilum NBRC 15030 = ATCC 35035]
MNKKSKKLNGQFNIFFVNKNNIYRYNINCTSIYEYIELNIKFNLLQTTFSKIFAVFLWVFLRRIIKLKSRDTVFIYQK